MKLLDEQPAVALQALESANFKVASWSTLGITILQGAAALLAVVAHGWTAPSWSVPLSLAAIGLATAGLRYTADLAKGRADALMRRRELVDGLGRSIVPRDLAEAMDDLPWPIRRLAENNVPREPYYASPLPTSPRRTINNTYESAWWTSRLARDMVFVESAKVLAIGSIALLLLRAATADSATLLAAGNYARLASSALLILFTQGPLRWCFQYVDLRDSAARVAAMCEDAMRGSPSEPQALEILMEYQVARKGAPPISSIVWSLRRDNLNRLWATISKDS